MVLFKEHDMDIGALCGGGGGGGGGGPSCCGEQST